MTDMSPRKAMAATMTKTESETILALGLRGIASFSLSIAQMSSRRDIIDLESYLITLV